MKLSRRALLRKSLQTVAGVSALSIPAVYGQSALAMEPISRAGRPRLLLSLAAYSFREFFTSEDPVKKLDFFRFIDFCAEHGCDGAEPTSYYFPKDVTPDQLTAVRRHAFLRGVAVSGTAVGNNFALPKGAELDTQIQDVKAWIDRAALLGAPHIRVFAGNKPPAGMSAADARKLCIEPIEQCCEYAGTKGIFLGLENHGGILDTSEALLEMVKAVKSPWFGVNLDTGNFRSEDPYADVTRCAPYAVNVQLKAGIHKPGTKEPVAADVPRLIGILKESGYQGYVALEYEGKEDPWKAVPELLSRMKALMAA